MNLMTQIIATRRTLASRPRSLKNTFNVRIAHDVAHSLERPRKKGPSHNVTHHAGPDPDGWPVFTLNKHLEPQT